MTRFQRYELRTTDVIAARAFYAAVLGERALDIVPLPEAAAARGAVPHWLGHLGVDDVDAAARAFVEHGATRLGPTRSTADGDVAILRDPGGAVVAVATRRPAPGSGDVVWHLLHTADLAGAIASYRALFGWTLGERVDLGPLGVYTQFSWRCGEASVGSMSAIDHRAGIHPHWQFHFRVVALEPALAVVREAGGVVVAVTELPDRGRVAVCDDPQGAAFALRERARG